MDNFTVEEPQSEVETPIQTVVNYPYADDFANQDHVAFLGMKEDGTCQYVIALQKAPESDSHLSVHKVLTTRVHPTTEFSRFCLCFSPFIFFCDFHLFVLGGRHGS